MPERKIGSEKPGNKTGDDGKNEPGGKQWFFGIGISEYDEFPNLVNAVKDVKDISELLVEDYGFLPEHSVTLINQQATKENIIDELDDLVKKVGTEDSLLVYFAGHGHMISGTQRGFWIPGDAKKHSTSNYLRNSTIREYLADIHSKHTLLIADSCFSGSLFVRGTSRSTAAFHELESIPSRWAICSGRHDEEVSDGNPGENSPFAQSILETLRGNTNQLFNVAKLVDRVVEQTRSNYEQLPEGNPVQGVGHKGGQYIFHRLAKEEKFWEECQRKNTIRDFSQYLGQFPGGAYAAEALDRIKELEDEEAWRKAERSGTVSAYHIYISHDHDRKKYVEEAKKRISISEKLEDSRAATEHQNVEGKIFTHSEKPTDQDQLGESSQKSEIDFEDVAPDRITKEQSPSIGGHTSVNFTTRFKRSFWVYTIASVAVTLMVFYWAVIEKQQTFNPSGTDVPAQAAQVETVKADEDQPPDAKPEQPEAETRLSVGEVFRDCGQCPEMVVIPEGKFEMGGKEREAQPIHLVSIDRFAMGKYEVTVDEYLAYATENEIDWFGRRAGRGKKPVTNITWQEAINYSNWLSAKSGHKYRLPRETEWEWAVRAGTTTEYWWGESSNDPERFDSLLFYKCEDHLHYIYGSPCQEGPVMRIANPFGLYDMNGSVREWTLDCPYIVNSMVGERLREHISYMFFLSEISTQYDCDQKIVRGGFSWNEDYSLAFDMIGQFRSAYRDSARQNKGTDGTGFRVVREISD